MNEKYTDTSEKTVLRKLSLFKRQFYGFLLYRLSLHYVE